ncbi:complement C5 isoform X2 [Astyanax mexicanus]|uniref:complement C5 isoform X2 n=1 Tax=Astyanax mexicanus TaxID=7994 RepID=UPI0020CAFF09|nr:complement C5 isoform X2 [Astyanax mexicanus]
MMRILLLLCVMNMLRWTEAQEKTYLITAPKLWRVDAMETVLVHLIGYEQETTVRLILKSSLLLCAKTYASESVILNAQNQFLASTTLRIYPKDISKEQTEVYLEAVSSSFSTRQKIPVTRQNGFLFIQTDKPLYTPEQKVEVRVYSLNAELRKSSRAVSLTFIDPEGTKMEVIEVADINGVKPLLPPFKIPLKPIFGVWKIEAAYTNDFSTTATAEFEIKEYVLPSISVRIQPEDNYVSIVNFEAFKINIFAKYVSGTPVDSAEVFLKFGYISNNVIVMLPSTLMRYTMYKGELSVELDIKSALSKMDSGPMTLRDMNNHFLHVVVLLQESTGGISQEAILSNVKFANAPFTLSLIATPPFIKPTLPYSIRVLVKDPLGEPVSGVGVKMRGTLTNTNQEQEPIRFQGFLNEITHSSQKDGVVYFIWNTPGHAAKADFTFETADPQYPPESQAQLQLKTEVYQSVNQRFLYIDLPSELSSFEVDSYANIKIYFSYRDYLPLKSFNYQIVSKGKVVKFATVQRVSEKSQNINFKVTADMVPSARLLVYYILSGEQRAELVADSVWLDIKAKCVNSLDVNLAATDKAYKPKDKLQLSVKTKSDSLSSLVALSAVDMALYNLRSNDKDPMNKVLRHFEHSDLGCGGGGGRNNIDVFHRAGLTFLTNANVMPSTADEACTAAVRPKRSTPSFVDLLKEKDETHKTVVRTKRSTIPLNDQFKQKAEKYKPFHLWCLAGTDSFPTLETCLQRTQRLKVEDRRCKRAFLECCLFAQDLRSKTEDRIILSRSEVEFLEDVAPVQVRSYFPESWLWEEHAVSRSRSLSITKSLPDSLTTWEMKAVGVFNNGICVADPVQVRVTQALSVDVPLPYSMVRGEQIELKGSVYNQNDIDTTFSVTLQAAEGVCVFRGTLQNEDGDPHVNKGKIRARSVETVRFFIMALEVGTHELKFTLTTTSATEILVKKLRVVPEGIRKETWIGGRIDPQGVYGKIVNRVEIGNYNPKNLVPKSTVDRELTINGELLGELLSIITDPKGIMKLLTLPRGSAEVELLSLLPVFYVYDYLERAEEWGHVGDISSAGLKRKMEEGIISIMSFKSKREHSFTLFRNKEASTWLTALMVKTLAKVDKYLPVDGDMLSNTVRWLITQCQNQDGSFSEKSSYKPNKLMGTGADVTDQAVYLTSFVAIGIKNALSVPKCNLQIYQDAVDKAERYLTLHAVKVKNLYVRALATYALNVIDQSSQGAVNMYEKLKKDSQVKGNPVLIRFWQEKDASQDPLKPNKATAATVETTAYALLSCLLRGDMNYAQPVVNWLTQDQRYGGGFHSTQDAILTLEALTQYRTVARQALLNMEVDVSYRRAGLIGRFSLSQNRPIGKPMELAQAEDIILKTGSSSGVAFANLKLVYYETVQSNEDCRFDMSIDVHSHKPGSDEPMERSPRIVACAKYRKPENEVEMEAGHTVMEINLPTGFTLVVQDLERLRDGLESRISDFEINGGQVILQMDSIPSDEFYCVGFRIQEVFTTGMNSASTFKVYEFHDPDNQCTKFYHLQTRKLLRLCNGANCQCMAAECCTFKPNIDSAITAQQRMQHACREGIKYAFKVRVTSTTAEGDFLTYNANVEQILKKGSEDIRIGTEVGLVKKATCSTNLEIGKHYLIMGAEIMQLRLLRSYRYKFPLDSQASVEWWPSESDCSESSCRTYLNILNEFEFDFSFTGCSGR